MHELSLYGHDKSDDSYNRVFCDSFILFGEPDSQLNEHQEYVTVFGKLQLPIKITLLSAFIGPI